MGAHTIPFFLNLISLSVSPVSIPLILSSRAARMRARVVVCSIASDLSCNGCLSWTLVSIDLSLLSHSNFTLPLFSSLLLLFAPLLRCLSVARKAWQLCGSVWLSGTNPTRGLRLLEPQTRCTCRTWRQSQANLSTLTLFDCQVCCYSSLLWFFGVSVCEQTKLLPGLSRFAVVCLYLSLPLSRFALSSSFEFHDRKCFSSLFWLTPCVQSWVCCLTFAVCGPAHFWSLCLRINLTRAFSVNSLTFSLYFCVSRWQVAIMRKFDCRRTHNPAQLTPSIGKDQMVRFCFVASPASLSFAHQFRAIEIHDDDRLCPVSDSVVACFYRTCPDLFGLIGLFGISLLSCNQHFTIFLFVFSFLRFCVVCVQVWSGRRRRPRSCLKSLNLRKNWSASSRKTVRSDHDSQIVIPSFDLHSDNCHFEFSICAFATVIWYHVSRDFATGWGGVDEEIEEIQGGKEENAIEGELCTRFPPDCLVLSDLDSLCGC